MAETKNPAGAKPIVDVAHPNASAPSGNSKSVIVSNRPILKDPMVVPSEEDPAIPEKSPDKGPLETTTKTTPKTAKPDAAPTKSDDAPAKSDDTKPAADTADADDKAKDEAKNADSETDATDEAQSSKTAQQLKDEAEAQAKQQNQQQAIINQLADGKKYYLPIDTVENRRSRRFVALGVLLSLLLILAWTDIALDAGLIQLGGVKPVTHFFSN